MMQENRNDKISTRNEFDNTVMEVNVLSQNHFHNIIKRSILLVILLAICSIIFMFSNQNSEKSDSTSDKIIYRVLDIITKNNDLSQQEYNELYMSVKILVRKTAHFTIYTLLGLFLMLVLNTININLKERILISWMIGIIYAIGDEIHQYFIPGRTPMMTDVIIDSIGVLCGILIVYFISKILYIKKRKYDFPNI